MPKVSILVPVYNVSAYIERCAHSLFRQTLDDVEYIFVDDCTPDDSMAKLEAVLAQYPERAGQVKIVRHERNWGLAVARRTALLAASGEYVCCVDSDDYVDADMAQCMYRRAVDEQADIVVADYWDEYSKQTVLCTDLVSPSMEENRVNVLTCGKEVSPSLWNKLIRRKFWVEANVFAPEGLNYGEDRHVVTRLYYQARKIVKVDAAFYHYSHFNAGAITRGKDARHFEDVILFWKLMDEFLAEHGLAEKYRDTVLAAEGFDEEAVAASVPVPVTWEVDEFVLYKSILDEIEMTEDELLTCLETTIDYYNHQISDEVKRDSIQQDNLIIPWLNSFELAFPDTDWQPF